MPGSGGKQPYGGFGQFGYRFASSFGVGRAAALGGVAGLAGAASAIALKKVFDLLASSVKSVIQEFDNARRLYASSLQSGLGLQFTSKRNLLANVIGVSEKEVFQFGQAIGFIGKRLDVANYSLAKTAPYLTATSYNFKILEANMHGLFATLANEAAPSLNIFADGLAKFTAAFTLFLQKDPIAKFVEKIGALIVLNPLSGIGKLLGGKDSGPAPNPAAFMKQIHASAWERMGLVVGGIGGQRDYASQTAQNTKATASAVQLLVKKMSLKDGYAGNSGMSFMSSSQP